MRFTIVTPTNNAEKFLEETIRSVIYQEGDFELEYILFDNCSTDRTLEIVRKFSTFIESSDFKPKCKKLIFKWFSEPDAGQSHAINKGFKISTGDIINWLCADDLLCSGSLQKIHEFFIKNPSARIVFGEANEIDSYGRIIKSLPSRSFERSDLIKRWNVAYHLFSLHQSSVFVKKEILSEIGYLNEDNKYSMDYEWYLRINKKYKFHFLDELISKNRTHSRAKSIKFRDKQYKESIMESKKYWKENYFYYFSSYYLYYPRYVVYNLYIILLNYYNNMKTNIRELD